MKHFFLLAAMLYTSFTFSQVTHILLDYDGVDELATINRGGAYERGFWKLNTRFPDDPSVMGLTWAVVRFDTLYDAGSDTAYAFAGKTLTIDSLRVFFTHENVSGTPDTVVISIYQYEGGTGLVIDSQEQIANTSLYDTTIITTSSLTSTLLQIEAITLRPNLQLAEGAKFLAGVHFYGDLANTFNLIAGYPNFCGSVCFDPSASPSLFEANSHYRIIFWDGPFRFTGVNSIEYDCDGDLIPGEPEECELFTIQNIVMQAFVSFGTDTSDTTSIAHAVLNHSVKIYPQPSDGYIFVEWDGFYRQSQISIADACGKTVYAALHTPMNGTRELIDIRNLPGGVYFLVLNNHHEVLAKKIIKN